MRYSKNSSASSGEPWNEQVHRRCILVIPRIVGAFSRTLLKIEMKMLNTMLLKLLPMKYSKKKFFRTEAEILEQEICKADQVLREKMERVPCFNWNVRMKKISRWMMVSPMSWKTAPLQGLPRCGQAQEYLHSLRPSIRVTLEAQKESFIPFLDIGINNTQELFFNLVSEVDLGCPLS